jgi:hypothetical protein
MACRVLGMTSAGDHVNILRTNGNTGTMAGHLLRFIQKGSLQTRVELAASLLVLQQD